MASIGASALSEKAKEHEFAAKEGNISFIKENGEEFISEYCKIIEFIGKNIEIDETCDETCYEASSDCKVSALEIKKIINAAIADIDDFESDAAIEKLNKLKEIL